MYYEERIIDGILCFRLSPEGAFAEVEKTELSKRVVKAEKAFFELKSKIQEIQLILS